MYIKIRLRWVQDYQVKRVLHGPSFQGLQWLWTPDTIKSSSLIKQSFPSPGLWRKDCDAKNRTPTLNHAVKQRMCPQNDAMDRKLLNLLVSWYVKGIVTLPRKRSRDTPSKPTYSWGLEGSSNLLHVASPRRPSKLPSACWTLPNRELWIEILNESETGSHRMWAVAVKSRAVLDVT